MSVENLKNKNGNSTLERTLSKIEEFAQKAKEYKNSTTSSSATFTEEIKAGYPYEYPDLIYRTPSVSALARFDSKGVLKVLELKKQNELEKLENMRNIMKVLETHNEWATIRQKTLEIRKGCGNFIKYLPIIAKTSVTLAANAYLFILVAKVYKLYKQRNSLTRRDILDLSLGLSIIGLYYYIH